ncbi:restriction endonuclease subunit S [Algoriphagus sp. PAP.12]|uniref:restriction endonuclease subunit S n=1 Tax=Algoriphagus sp. PAP.12 TaxID=2996678 RepID=UPI00227D270E|nr:restriction endonuclease subunit S [Algoriphagus sp. PAP.12]
MKYNWIKIKLFEIVEFQRGLTYSKKDEVDFSINVVLRSNNINLSKNDLDLSELKFINPSIEIPNIKKVKKGSLIICTANGSKNHLGKVALIDSDYNYAFGGFMGQITPKQKLDSKFLFYLMISDEYKKFIKGLSDGANINNLKFGDLGQFEIPLPPLQEQQRIVSILDECFAAIDQAKANAEQNLKNAKELFESYLQGVFEKKGDGWEEKTLGEFCVFTQGIQRDVKLQSETKGENQVRFLRIVDFTQGNEPPRYIDFPGDKYILNTEDISLVRYGASTGFVCRGLEGALANNLFRVIPKSKKEITNDFLFIYLNSPVFQNVIKESMNGAAMPAISFGLIKDIPFPVISIEEQQIIVRQLDTLRAETQKLEEIYQQKLADLEELKKSVLEKAFNGELTGREVEV